MRYLFRLGLGDLNDIFDSEPFSGGVTSPGEVTDNDGAAMTGVTGTGDLPGQDPAFRYKKLYTEKSI